MVYGVLVGPRPRVNNQLLCATAPRRLHPRTQPHRHRRLEDIGVNLRHKYAEDLPTTIQIQLPGHMPKTIHGNRPVVGPSQVQQPNPRVAGLWRNWLNRVHHNTSSLGYCPHPILLYLCLRT